MDYQGFYDGVTGVVMKPIKGAQEDGVEGFFKGLGKGAVGLFVRPVTGIVDFTSGSLDAVKRYDERCFESLHSFKNRYSDIYFEICVVIQGYGNHR